MAEEERKRPFAVEQANREVKAAKERLDRAKELGPANGEGVRLAQEAYDEAVAAREGLRGKNRGERREARREFMRDYYDELGPYVAQLAKEDPELRQLIQDAIANGWDAETFRKELKRSDWWQDENKTNAWLAAFEQEFGDDPGGQWNKTLADAKEAVLDLARSQGLTLADDVVERIARRSIYQGWDERDLREWVGQRIETGLGRGTYEVGGSLLTAERTLRRLARDFGLTYDDQWFANRANNLVNRPEQYSQDDFINEMVQQAESLFPVFAGRLSADYTVRDAAGAYLSQMANLLELNDASQIDLNDPLLKKAFGSAMSSDGTPQLMSLWDFQKEIRKDDRWQYTANAQSTYLDIGTGLARTMGFLG